jgi:hypothetical protein
MGTCNKWPKKRRRNQASFVENGWNREMNVSKFIPQDLSALIAVFALKSIDVSNSDCCLSAAAHLTAQFPKHKSYCTYSLNYFLKIRI